MIHRLTPIRRSIVWFRALLVLLLASSVRAELPEARLTSIFPPGAKQGTTVEVTLTGQDLDEITTLHFSDPKITAKPATAANKFQVTIPAETPLGTCDARAIGRYGVSNPRAFVIGALAEIINKSGNTSPAAAAPIAPGQTLSAVAEANALHYYKLPLKKSQRIFAEIEAPTIDSRMEPSIILTDANGNDRVISRRGELIDFTAPADGDYFLKVYDFTYRGGAEFFYRLTVSAGPHIDFILPPAGTAGVKNHFTIFGRNLPGGTAAIGRFAARNLEQLAIDIELPSDPQAAGATFSHVSSTAAFMDGIDYRLTTAAGVSNSIRIGFATAPVVLRDSSETASAPPQKFSIPCEVAGRFFPRSQPHTFTFEAPANSIYYLEVLSNRLGNVTAPFMVIQRVGKDEKGDEKLADVQEVYEAPPIPGGAEFRTTSRDPIYRLETKEAATYRVILRDLFTTPAEDAALCYRLSIRKESPDFRLVVCPALPVVEKDSKGTPISTPILRRGGITPIKVAAQRQDGFAGEIQLKLEGLPPGVTCAATSIAPSASFATLLLCAADDAPAGFGPLQITGAATINGAAITRSARPGTVATSNYDTQNKAVEVASRRTRELFVAVIPEPAPLLITQDKPAPLETCVFNKLTIPIKIVRRGDITGPVTLKLAGHPLVDKVKEVAIAPPGDTAAFELDLAQMKLTPGVYNLNAESLVKLKYRTNVEAAKAADDAVKQAEKTATDLAAAAKTAAVALAALKPDAAERKAAEQANNDAAKKARDGEAAKTAAVARAKDLNAKAAPKDMAASFYSLPIRLTVTAAPINLAPPVTATIEAGGKIEIPIAITRLYGFADPVDLTLVAPNVKGLTGKLTLAKDQASANLPIQSDAATPAGKYAVKLEAKMKLAGQTISIEQALSVNVTEKKLPAKAATTQATTKPK